MGSECCCRIGNEPFRLCGNQRAILSKDANARKQIISDMIDQELMVQEAAAQKIENSKEYKDQMALLRKQTLVNAIVAKNLAPKVTSQAVKSYFDTHRNRYSTDQVHAQHILVSTQAEAQAILAEVKKPGADFQRIAETRSKDPTAKSTRGDVGYFSRGMFDQAFTEAAFQAKSGEIVGPVKTAFGYHVIRVLDRKTGKLPEYAEVEQAVRADFQRELLRNYLSELRKKAKIKE
ncbi:MAG: hypothetical protein EBX52_00020 [Proteobacteria bacterium]|nr:hypothetical protein [Pseudomonadota bacterium]